MTTSARKDAKKNTVFEMIAGKAIQGASCLNGQVAYDTELTLGGMMRNSGVS